MGNLNVNPFLFKDDHVSILSGEEEAVYAWLSVNYLNGFFATNMSVCRSFSLNISDLKLRRCAPGVPTERIPKRPPYHGGGGEEEREISIVE